MSLISRTSKETFLWILPLFCVKVDGFNTTLSLIVFKRLSTDRHNYTSDFCTNCIFCMKIVNKGAFYSQIIETYLKHVIGFTLNIEIYDLKLQYRVF